MHSLWTSTNKYIHNYNICNFSSYSIWSELRNNNYEVLKREDIEFRLDYFDWLDETFVWSIFSELITYKINKKN